MSTKKLPNYIKLFGNIDFSEADQARSVYSPAAYLTDLLQLIDDHMVLPPVQQPSGGSHPSYTKHLDQRRSDIKQISLDATQTFSTRPYLDIVNRVLENKINPSSNNDAPNDLVYDELRQKNYPFNLPFNRDHEQIALYEKYLGTTAETFHKVFAESYDKDVLAREYLGLSEEEVAIIVTKTAGDVLSSQFGKWLPATRTQIPVDVFLKLTDLTHQELRELLVENLANSELENKQPSVFFCNFKLGGFAAYDAAGKNITWLGDVAGTPIPDQWLDRAQRLIRLSRRVGLTLADIALIIRTCCSNKLNEQSLRRIAVIKKLSASLELRIDEACALFSPMNDIGYGGEDLPVDLFNRIFNNRIVQLDKTYIGETDYWKNLSGKFTQLKYTGDILSLENKRYRTHIAQSLQITEKQLQLIVRGFRSRFNEDVTKKSNLDSLWSRYSEERYMLSALYRTTQLAGALETSCEDLFILLDILERDPAIRQLASADFFIDYSIKEKNGYKILRKGTVRQLLWLVQSLCSLTKWLSQNGLTAEELLRVCTGRQRRNLKDVTAINGQLSLPVMAEKEALARKREQKEKIELLNGLYSQLKPWLLDEKSFVSSTIDQRFSRIIHDVVTHSDLVAKSDKRLVRSGEEALNRVALDAIERIDRVTSADFHNLGLEEKVIDKIFGNLILMGVLSTDGMLNKAMVVDLPADFNIANDFSHLRTSLFEIMQTLHEDHVDIAIYPSDLEVLDLSRPLRDELYDNLVFNGFLAEDGTLLQATTLSSIGNLDLFEVNSGVNEYAGEVHALFLNRLKKFEQSKIVITKTVFIDLPLTEMELEDLIENLRFNEYTDAESVLVDNSALLSVTAENLLLELRFYPQRHGILSALQSHIKRHKSQFYLFSKQDFMGIANHLVADWVFTALSHEYLSSGRISTQAQTYFEDPENAGTLDIDWPFESNHNRVVFERMRSIVMASRQYQLHNAVFESIKFTEEEISELITVLTDAGYLTSEYKLTAEKIPYFLNINNALEFNVEAFEDYNKDIFFLLHDIAKRIDKISREIITLHTDREVGQTNALYQSLEEVLGLSADSIAVVFSQVFAGSSHVRDEWWVPILATVNLHDEIVEEPQSSRFNTAYRRIRQFALLANKLKLDKDEIGIAFHDQNLVEKYPESIELPEMNVGDDEGGVIEQVAGFDALLESRDGHIYLFRSADEANGNDHARYWAYSAITHELIDSEDNQLSTLLTGNKESPAISRVDAAFVNKQGNDVLIADGQYYVREQKITIDKKNNPDQIKSGGWKIQPREWGKVDSDFDNLQVVDAAFTDDAGRTYLFSNEQYVRCAVGNSFVDDGYPKSIADSWQDEGKSQNLPEEFQTTLDAAFHGTDNQSYLFKDGQFINADEPEVVRSIRDTWAKVRNNLQDGQEIDAFFADKEQVFVLAGDQVFAYRDSLENENVLLQEGFPKSLRDHFGSALPGEFHAGVDAVFKGEDGQIHLFKGDRTATINAVFSETTRPAKVIKTQGRWGLVDNKLLKAGKVDATLAGLDGRVYLFSGRQYFRYSGNDYTEVDSGYPRDVRADWGGLHAISAAFVMDGKTYLFGRGKVRRDDGTIVPDSKNAYVRYSGNDYEKPDDGYPKERVELDNDWWNFPESLKNHHNFTKVDAVFNAPDGKTYLFSGKEFVYFDRLHRWWSEPQSLTDKWGDLPFDTIAAAFSGKDGKTYFFSGDEYVRFSGDDYDRQDNGYPRPTNKLWGNVNNNITERGRVDAALVVESREIKKQIRERPSRGEGNEKTVKTVKTMHTYLFSGQQFVRYKGDDYTNVEPGYPKTLDLLKNEPRFKNLSVMPKQGIGAAFADLRTVYLLDDSSIQVVSGEKCAKYEGKEIAALADVDTALSENGAIYIEKGEQWYHLSHVEGGRSSTEPAVTLTPEIPALLVNLDDTSPYKTGLDTVLSGRDSNTYFFKGSEFYDLGLNRTFPVSEQWGRVRNAIQDKEVIDAAFVGRDGKTYIFSGDQYVVYDGSTYIGQTVFHNSQKTQPAIKSIAEDWGSLTNVHLAFVMDEHTYLFEKADDHGHFRFVRYSSTDYERPDTGFPKRAGHDYWQMPDDLQAQGWGGFDEILIENDTTMIFIKGREFLQFDTDTGSWFHPKSLDKLWKGIPHHDPLFDDLQSLFVGADGTPYFFGAGCYVTHDGEVFSSHRPICEDWGILPGPFKDKVDAAFVHDNARTYLFASDQYIRYSGTDYCYIDDGYPKLITQSLREEPGFENLPREFEVRAGELGRDADAVVINAVVANSRSIYLFMGGDCYAISDSETASYSADLLGQQRNVFHETGQIDAAFVCADRTDKKKTYLFSGDQYVRYSKTSTAYADYTYVDDGYPRRITTSLATDLAADFGAEGNEQALIIPPYFHSDIDAALSDAGDTVYLFKGKHFYGTAENKEQVIKGTWGLTKNNFLLQTPAASGNTSSIDGAFVDNAGRLYAFKGDQVIRYADSDQSYADTGYPQQITATFPLPGAFDNSIDGAFTFEGRTYLVKGDEYTRYQTDDFESTPGFYPVKFAERWGQWSDYCLEDIRLIARFKSLQDNYRGDHTLVDLLRRDRDHIKQPYTVLADIFNWDIEEVKWVKRHNAFLPQNKVDETQFDLELICRIFDILEVSANLAIDARSAYESIWLKRYSNEPELAEVASTLSGLLAIKNGNSPDWNVLLDEIHNALNLLKRDVLVPYAIYIDDSVDDTRGLYEQLLIDIQMGEVAKISPIKEAISAVQLYFHRYFLNLESIDLKGDDDENHKQVLQERWQWMRNYRVWEANRKVFLYPENYIRPELRDNKTPEFKALEESLMQGELTEANITYAFNQYIDRYIEVSRLTIAGGYVYNDIADKNDKQIILFGHTKSEPRQYSYRTATFVDGQSDSVIWQPWLDVNVQIEADRVYPVYILNKVFVFWAKVEVRSSVGSDTQLELKGDMNSGFASKTNASNESVLQVYYSYFNLNGEWAPPQKLAYEIISDDTIIDFSLDSIHLEKNAITDLENIQMSCYYTTERQVKPMLNVFDVLLGDKEVLPYFTGKQGKPETEEDNDIPLEIYIKAGGSRKPYYIDALPNGQAVKVKYIPSGETLNSVMKFKVVRVSSLSIGGDDRIAIVAFESVSDPGYYLSIRSDEFRLQKEMGETCRFFVSKGSGGGYSLVPVHKNAKGVLAYTANGQAEIDLILATWDSLNHPRDRPNAAFNFIVRKELSNTFRFYPETNNAISDNAGNQTEVFSEQHITPTLESGIKTFKKLFPDEDITQLGKPVLLSLQDSLPWVCFDYKGGSFLCKPASGQIQHKEAIETLDIPSDFGTVSAAFHLGGHAHFFSKRGLYFREGDSEASLIKDVWGEVDNNIQRDSRVDAALAREARTFLFRGDQYVAYTHNARGGRDEYVDASYPRSLANNSDALPDIAQLGWTRIDAAFSMGSVSYFIYGEDFVTSENLALAHKVFGGLLPTQDLPAVTGITSLFSHEGNIAISHMSGGSSFWSQGNSLRKIKTQLNEIYQAKSGSEIPLEQVVTAFAVGKTVYMKVVDSSDSASFVRYEGGARTAVFKDLNPAQKMKAVFVAGNKFYILNTPSAQTNPVIRIWDTHNLAVSASDVAGAQSIEIIDAPQSLDTFFAHNDQTYILSLQSDQYMLLDHLPGQRAGNITWQNTGSIKALIERLGVLPPLSQISAGFNLDGRVYLMSGQHYFGFKRPEGMGIRDVLSETVLSYPETFGLLSDALRNDGPSWEGLDAVFQGADGISWFFKDRHYFHSGMNEGLPSPVEISKTWGKVRNTIQQVESAFVIKKHIYLISGGQYYRYFADNLNPPLLDAGYPKRLAGNTDRLPAWIGSTLENEGVVVGFDNKIYGLTEHSSHFLLLLGVGSDWNHYTEFNPQTGEHSAGYVKDKWQFKGSFRSFQAAFSKDGFTYLLKGKKILKYQEPGYDIIRLSSMTGSQLSQTLFASGISGLMQLENQEINELPTFEPISRSEGEMTRIGQAEEATIRFDRGEINVKHLPVNSHLEFRGANGIYYWELFYHAPVLIAQALNTAQKFEEAKQWYEYIFDPVSGHDYWKFLPFLAVDIETLIAAVSVWHTRAEIGEKGQQLSQKLSERLRKFAPALSGQVSMNPGDSEEFGQLGQWDDETGEFSTWADISLFEQELNRLLNDEAVKTKATATLEVLELIKRLPVRYNLMVNNGVEQIKAYLDDPFDPHAIASLRRIAYRRTTVMAYIDNLLDWGDMLFRQYSHESINEARMLYILAYDLLGKKPDSVGIKIHSPALPYKQQATVTESWESNDSIGGDLDDKGADSSIANQSAYDFLFDVSGDNTDGTSFTHAGIVHESVGNPYFYVPENEQITGYWERVEDRLYKIRQSLNIMGIAQPLPLFQPPIDPMSIVNAVAGGGGVRSAVGSLSVAVPHYRFTFMLSKARELVSKLSQFGNELLGTVEKKDAEALSLLQNQQEGVILRMTHAIKEAQLHEAKENLKYLESSKVGVEEQKKHYDKLLAGGLITEEVVQIAMMGTASSMFFSIPTLKLAAALASVFPDIKLGAPTTIGAEIGGSLVAGALGFAADALESYAEGYSIGGEVAGIMAQYARSREDWELQHKMAISEIEQLAYQIEGAHWQVRAAEHELIVHEKEADHNQSINTFMKGKFSNEQLYLWMSNKLSVLYFQTYKLAHDMAKSAEMAYRFERGAPESQTSFIGGSYWDSLHKGLLAGESLGLDLDRMESAYMESDIRGFEITKTISLVALDPMAYLELKSKGVCEFNFSEALFDYDFPGHYCRQVKSIALKLDAGKGKTVNATLTQLRNKTVIEPDVKAVKYLIDPKDSQPTSIRNDWKPSQQIAVSDIDPYTENSSGLFELRFDDDRYLPFEGTGAVSSWQLELSGKRGSYDVNELTDVEIELKYTAYQGGQSFADAVKGLLKPYETSVYIDMAQRFPNEFFAFVNGETETLEINVTRGMFPNLSGGKITGIYSFFEMKDGGQISLVMNDDGALTLRANKLLLTGSLVVGPRGETWSFKAKGQKLDLVNMGLVFAYKAIVE